MKKIVFLMGLLLPGMMIYAQPATIDMTIKPGGNDVTIYAKPTGSGGPFSIQFSQFNFVVGVEASCLGANPAPTAAFSMSSWFTTNFGSSLAVAANKTAQTVTINGVDYVVWEWSITPATSNFATMTASTEYAVASIDFTGTNISCDVSLLDDGSNSTTNTYIADAGLGTYFTPQFSDMDFYSSSGNSILNYTGTSGAKVTTSTTIVLPLRLLDFSGTYNDKCHVSLNWSAVEGDGCSHFEVEYSSDARNFSPLGTVPYQQSGGKTSYSFDTETGNGYYRLKLVDYNGTYTYSKLIGILTSCNDDRNASQVQLFPNPVPAGTTATLRFESAAEGSASMIIADLYGRQISNEPVVFIEGVNVYPINTLGLAAGTYVILMRTTSGEILIGGERQCIIVQ